MKGWKVLKRSSSFFNWKRDYSIFLRLGICRRSVPLDLLSKWAQTSLDRFIPPPQNTTEKCFWNPEWLIAPAVEKGANSARPRSRVQVSSDLRTWDAHFLRIALCLLAASCELHKLKVLPRSSRSSLCREQRMKEPAKTTSGLEIFLFSKLHKSKCYQISCFVTIVAFLLFYICIYIYIYITSLFH